jgi:N-acetylmuramoyl-L-alanine amidase
LQGNPFYRDQLPEKREPAAAPPPRIAALSPPKVVEAPPVIRQEEKSQKTFVIVIDPGHGGKDPGAVSRDGRLKEKEVALDIGKRLKRSLQQRIPGVGVHLTREEDRFLTLQERTAIANATDADLFISVHCNGATDSSFRGIETFYLSKASSPRAMKLAARENGIPLAKMTDLEATLLDLMLTSKKTESDALAREVHTSMVRSIKRIMPASRDRGVKQAPFHVLLGAKMPAILVECAFISSSEKNKLNSSGYLDSVAEGISVGAESYLSGLGRKAPSVCR